MLRDRRCVQPPRTRAFVFLTRNGRAGFVRFTSTYHLILITKRSKVAVLGGHHVFHSEGTDLHEISPVPAAVAAEDARQKHSFMSVHLSKNFYFR